jgi:hypothetical protein
MYFSSGSESLRRAAGSVGCSLKPPGLPRSIRESVLLLAWSVFLLLGPANLSYAQVDPAAGVHPFYTYVGGQYDTIDPASANVLVTIPVLSKTGKIPFSYSLVGNFHMYVPYSENGGTVPIAVTSSITGALSPSDALLNWSETSSDCTDPNGQEFQYFTDFGFETADNTGAIHTFSQVSVQYGDLTCAIPATAATYAADDGSGYTVVVTPGSPASEPPTYTLYDRSGDLLDSPGNEPINIHTITDPDGIQISTANSAVSGTQTLRTVYTDTLARTALTATVVGSFARVLTPFTSDAGNPDTYFYTGPGSSSQEVQVNYTQFPQRTNSSCGQYNPDLNRTGYFATSIVMPDGRTFGLSYEATPGYPGDITGRLARITLPENGYVSFTYSGGHNGFACTVSDTMTMTRTLNDGMGHSSTWTYVGVGKSANGSNSVVTVTDPSGNVTTYHFNGEFQTEQVVQDAVGNVLSTTVTCYNGNNSSQSGCITPASYVPSRITQTDVYTSLGSSPPSLVETKYDDSGTGSSWGDVTAIKQYDIGATYPPSGTPVSETDTNYANVAGTVCGSVSPYIHDHPCVTVTYNSSLALLAQTINTYNIGGHLTQTKRWISGSTYLTSSASDLPPGN